MCIVLIKAYNHTVWTLEDLVQDSKEEGILTMCSESIDLDIILAKTTRHLIVMYTSILVNFYTWFGSLGPNRQNRKIFLQTLRYLVLLNTPHINLRKARRQEGQREPLWCHNPHYTARCSKPRGFKGTVSWDRFQKFWQKFTELGLTKGRGWFLNFLWAQMILQSKKFIYCG